MRFKTSNIKEAKHSELVSCVGWASPDDVISIGDDHQILRWNLVSAETVKVEKEYFWRQCCVQTSRALMKMLNCDVSIRSRVGIVRDSTT